MVAVLRKSLLDSSLHCRQCVPNPIPLPLLVNSSVEGLDVSMFECVYSPAKRRGPVPGRSGQSRKASEAFTRPQTMENDWHGGMGGTQSMEELQLRQMMLQNMGGGAPALMDQGGGGFLDSQQAAIQQQLNLIQQLQAQQVMNDRESEQPARRMKLEQPKPTDRDSGGVPRTIAAHTHLLELSDPDGSRLRSYYRLSVDELFCFPPTPTDEEYCMRLNIPGMTPRMIPGTHLAALSAARFAEVALGAIVHNEVSLAMELCNAVVHCLRESVQEPVQPPYMFEVARSYFLLGVFRAFRGDMVRYFKYRRVCMTYISKLEVSKVWNESMCILLHAVHLTRFSLSERCKCHYSSCRRLVFGCMGVYDLQCRREAYSKD
jgi:hypothetical protein